VKNMGEIERLVKKIKRSKNKKEMIENLNLLLSTVDEEIELLKLQLSAREKELMECKKELREIHKSISYRVARWISETKIGYSLKRLLWKIFRIK